MHRHPIRNIRDAMPASVFAPRLLQRKKWVTCVRHPIRDPIPPRGSGHLFFGTPGTRDKFLWLLKMGDSISIAHERADGSATQLATVSRRVAADVYPSEDSVLRSSPADHRRLLMSRV